MDKQYLITSNLEKGAILVTVCGRINAPTVRQLREEIAPFLKLFDTPISLVIDLRESTGNQLDALDELRALWAEYEQAQIGQIIRIFANELEDQGTKITDQFHMRGIRKHTVTTMARAIGYCESFAESLSSSPGA